MAHLNVENGALLGHEIALGESQTIGRLARNEICVEDSRMSRQNTRIYRLGRRWMVEDLDSKNGTFLNGNQIDKAMLSDGDELRVGETLFRFTADENFAADEISLEDPADVKIGDKPLTFSKHAKEDATQTSFLFLRQDLGQRDGGFRFLIIIGLLLVMGGLFWLVQMLVAKG